LRYISTRGQAPVLEFGDVLLAGLARDGGLYLPEEWPQISADDLRSWRGLPYAELAFRVMRPFVGDAISDDDFRALVADSYAGFNHPAVAPLRQIDSNLFLLELFHGPTLAFKDFALQVLGRLFDHVLARHGERATIVGATSGDTGSAAIEACRGRDAVDIFILHPKGLVSDIQRRQMTTVSEANVHNIAIEGNFDDCQDLVKAMFNDEAWRDALKLSAVNSINWARIMAQIVYYIAAAIALGAPDRRIAFSVPTGNFGDIFAGYAASRMGLPIEQLIIANNANDILARFMETGEMTAKPVAPTLSPAMDIQVSSNFERLLFELHGRNGSAVAQAMAAFREGATMSASPGMMAEVRSLFDATRLDDDGIKAMIARTQKETGVTIDPHTATSMHAAAICRRDAATPMVVLSTAHPAKFTDAVRGATGTAPEMPASLADLMDREEQVKILPNDLKKVQRFISARSRAQNPSRARA
jgi:threonine synthase